MYTSTRLANVKFQLGYVWMFCVTFTAKLSNLNDEVYNCTDCLSYESVIENYREYWITT